MAGIKELQTRVRTLIKPWTASDQEPPFTPSDLITMALILNNRTMKEPETLDWIERNFKYYQVIVTNVTKTPRSGFDDDSEDDYSPTFKDLTQSYVIKTAFGKHEIPAIEISPGEWTLRTNEARIYLQQKFGSSPPGTFLFFRLPAELRSVIYDMVFQYPISGLLVPLWGGDFEMMTQSLTEPFPVAGRHDADSRSHRWKYTQSFPDALKLLLVNKQILEEAFPCFFRLNLFYFAICNAAYNFLSGLVPHRRQHITQIGIEYYHRDTEIGPRVFDYLVSLPNLRKLYIKIDEDEWNGPYASKQLDIRKIPGLEKLRKIRVEKVLFTGNSPQIEAYLKAEMEGKGAKKRKTIASETTAREQRGRAAKRGRKDYVF